MADEAKFITVFNNLKNKLDTVSPTFCAAKWKQVSILLNQGRTHSCHHPGTHEIPLGELKNNSSALHNTNYKKQQRQLMLQGLRPKECDYCWRVEDSKTDGFSDRFYKSISPWADIDNTILEIKNNEWDYDVVPSYLEVSFSSLCNFKCIYCGPNSSTRWQDEMRTYGNYPLVNMPFNSGNYNKTEEIKNLYIEAFWKWFPNIVHKLHNLRITGGEPLLSDDTFKVLEFLENNPQPNLIFNINTNLCVPLHLIEKLVKKLVYLQNNNCVKNVTIFTSCEATKQQSEYIRFGIDYMQWLKNCEYLAGNIPNVKITIMATYNILSVFTFTDFVKDMIRLKQKFNQPKNFYIDIPYLRYPEFLAVWNIPDKFFHYIEDTISLMSSHIKNEYFTVAEVSKIKNILVLCKSYNEDPTKQDVLKHNRRNFGLYVQELDRRRNTNFVETFPELAPFLSDWQA